MTNILKTVLIIIAIIVVIGIVVMLVGAIATGDLISIMSGGRKNKNKNKSNSDNLYKLFKLILLTSGTIFVVNFINEKYV